MKDENELLMMSRGGGVNEIIRDRSASHRIKSTTKSRHEVKPLTKIVIRHLPGRITKTELLRQLEPLPEYNYLNFVTPDWTLGTKHAYSRAYINFVNPQDVYDFKNKYDNTLFYYDNTVTTIIIEFAPFQRIPKIRIGRRKDDKCGTIEQCDEYKQFLYNYELNTKYNNIFSNITNNQQQQLWFQKIQTTAAPLGGVNNNIDHKNAKLITTPLLDFIKQQKIDKQKLKYQKKQIRDKERKLRRCDSDNKNYLRNTFDYQKNDNNNNNTIVI